jgi:hypothetical protein
VWRKRKKEEEAIPLFAFTIKHGNTGRRSVHV